MINLFKTHYSTKAILTIEKSDKIEENKPVSLVAIAKTHKLDQMTIVEDRMAGFIEIYKNLPCRFQFGLRLMCCEDVENKSEESFKTEHKIIIFAANTEGYFDLLKIHNEAQTKHFYYIPRVDFKVLKRLWTKNLRLAIPFYDSFLHVNNFSFGACFLDFGGLEPIFFHESHDLIFDSPLSGIVKDFAAKNKYPVEEANTCLYYKPEDFVSWITYRCITDNKFGKKKTLASPELQFCSSDNFCFLRQDTNL